jgi:Undecaprenyl-phosphate glucose phosphotransferase
MLKRHSYLMLFLLGCGDILVAAASWGAGYLLRMLFGKMGVTDNLMPSFSEFSEVMVLSLVLSALLFHRLGLYGPKRTRRSHQELFDVARAVIVAWVLSYLAVLMIRHRTVSRLTMVSVLGSWLVLACSFRAAARSFLRSLRKHGRNLRHAAIIGAGRLGQHLYHQLRRNTWTGIQVGYFVDNDPRQETIEGLRIYKPLNCVADILTIKPVDIVFVALPGGTTEQMAEVLAQLGETSADIQVVPDLLSYSFLKHDVTIFENLPIISMTHSPQHGFNSLLKRSFDILFSLVMLGVLAIPMLLIALLVKLTSKGPVFYRQIRSSLAGHPFGILKFRTMRTDAEEQTGAVWASKDDPRVTRLGKFLRKSNLDELPQLFNILVGHMSVVGPRPERPELIDRFRKEVPRYMLRDRVRPGLTGWAQVNGWRGRTSLRKRIQYDLYYVNNWTFGLDLRIILLTLWRSFRDPNAY